MKTSQYTGRNVNWSNFYGQLIQNDQNLRRTHPLHSNSISGIIVELYLWEVLQELVYSYFQ